MSMLRTRPQAGLGDWFDPTCTPGTPGCVPHWYCYIPAMATPDCWASFQEGLSEGAAVVGGAVTGTTTSVTSGFVEGLASGFLPRDPETGDLNWTRILITGGVIVGAIVIVPRLLDGGGRRRRR